MDNLFVIYYKDCKIFLIKEKKKSTSQVMGKVKKMLDDYQKRGRGVTF